MFSQKNSGRAFGAALATLALPITVALAIWSGLHVVVASVIFILLWFGIYFAGVWAIVDRPAELNKKFPINSTERRRRRKAFWDWVNSLPRH